MNRTRDSASSARRVASFLLGALLGLASGLLAIGARSVAAELISVDGRPAELHVPASYVPGEPAPLVILLHGYGSSAAAQEAYMQFAPLSEQHGFLYLRPDGTFDCGGRRFWNATEACCYFCGTVPDDSGYLRGLIEALKLEYDVDPRRVYLIGHSNGGFMSYRSACDHADAIAAIASLAGATHADPADCTPSEPVHALQVHGTEDSTILYEGGEILGDPYPGAVATTELWAGYAGCELVADSSAPPLDLVSDVPGSETTRARYATGCAAGGAAELWTIQGGSHVPALGPDFAPAVIDWLLDHPKPAGEPVPLLPPLALAALAGLAGALLWLGLRGLRGDAGR